MPNTVFLIYLLLFGYLMLKTIDAGTTGWFCPGCDSRRQGEHAKGCHFEDRD